MNLPTKDVISHGLNVLHGLFCCYPSVEISEICVRFLTGRVLCEFV